MFDAISWLVWVSFSLERRIWSHMRSTECDRGSGVITPTVRPAARPVAVTPGEATSTFSAPMPLRRKLLLAMVIPALLLGIVGGIGAYSLLHLEQAAGRILSNNYRSIQATRRMEHALRDLESYPVAGERPGDESPSVMADAFDDALRSCEQNITESGERSVLARIRRRWTAIRPTLVGSGGAAREHRSARALYDDMDELISLNERAMIDYERETRRVAGVMLAGVSTSAVVAIAALALFALVSARRIATPVTQVADTLHQALNPGPVSDGTDGARTGDEIARLREELDALLGRLRRYEDEQSQKLSHLQGRFISMLSHQIKTPMTSLSMSVNLLREKLTGLSDAQAELLAIATEDCNALSALVTDFVEAARSVTPDLTVEPRVVDVLRLLRSALRPLIPQAEDKGIELVLPADAGGVLATVDPVKFPWVVTNIAGNALRYTRRGGRITVGIERSGAIVEVTIADTGVGISEADLGRIFEPYVSLDEEPQPGTHGLGLAIAREIVEAHHGSIEAASVPGAGTSFRIRFPAELERGA